MELPKINIQFLLLAVLITSIDSVHANEDAKTTVNNIDNRITNNISMSLPYTVITKDTKAIDLSIKN